MRQCPPFARFEIADRIRRQPGLSRKRMMHERDDPQPRRLMFDLRGHRAAGKAVDDDERSWGNVGQGTSRAVERRLVWKREQRGQACDLHLQT